MKRVHILLLFFLLVCFIPIVLWGGCLYIAETDVEETNWEDCPLSFFQSFKAQIPRSNL